MAVFFNNPMPMSGAMLIENPAKLFVDRAARAIQYDPQLYAAFKSGNFFNDKANVQRAVQAALDFQPTRKKVRDLKADLIQKHGGSKAARATKEAEAAFNAAWKETLEKAGISLPAAAGKRLPRSFRKALSYALSRGQAYKNAQDRNRSRYLQVMSAATGIPVVRRGDEFFLGKYKQFGVKKRSSKDKSWTGQLKTAAGDADMLKFLGIRGPGQHSASAAKEALIQKYRAKLGKDFYKSDEWKQEKAAYRAANKQKAETRRAAHAANLAQALADEMDDMKLRYRPLGLVAGSGKRATGEKQASAAAKSLYRSAKGATKMLTDKQAASPIYAKWSKVMPNPFSSLSSDELGYDALALSNPAGIGALDSIESAVARVPVIGNELAAAVVPVMATVVVPVIGAAAAGAVHVWLVPKLQAHLPEAAQPFAYTIGGVGVGTIAALVASKLGGEVGSALRIVGAAAAAVGVGVDVYRRYGSSEAATGALALSGVSSDEMGALALSGVSSDEMGALALSGLGDGGAYQIQNLGFDGDHSALSSMYADACAADAYYSGPDLDGVEGEAALAGASAYMGAFGASPIRAAGQRRAQSRHAGLRGHRWGWLIKMVGFQNFQKIVALPPEQRVAVIKGLREQALASVQKLMDDARAASLASRPVTAPPALAVSGQELAGYGTTIFGGGNH